jgi:hypothetical protein
MTLTIGLRGAATQQGPGTPMLAAATRGTDPRTDSGTSATGRSAELWGILQFDGKMCGPRAVNVSVDVAACRSVVSSLIMKCCPTVLDSRPLGGSRLRGDWDVRPHDHPKRVILQVDCQSQLRRAQCASFSLSHSGSSTMNVLPTPSQL